MKRNLSKIVALLVVVVMVFVSLTSMASAAATLNDIEGHWANNYIQTLADKGIINGYPDGTFKPDNSITRAEFCKTVVGSLVSEGKIGYVTTTNTFIDVPSSEWFSKYVETAYANNLVSGKGNGLFDPEANITRQEMAKIVALVFCKLNSTSVNVMKEGIDLSSYNLTDLNEADEWATDFLAVALSVGLMKGDGSTFRPQGQVTRAETATVTYRIIMPAGTPIPTQTLKPTPVSTPVPTPLSYDDYATYVQNNFSNWTIDNKYPLSFYNASVYENGNPSSIYIQLNVNMLNYNTLYNISTDANYSLDYCKRVAIDITTTIYDDAKTKYPNKNIVIGIVFNDYFTTNPENFFPAKDITYDSSTGKYKVISILAVLDDEGGVINNYWYMTIPTVKPTIKLPLTLYSDEEKRVFIGKLNTNKFDVDGIYNEFGIYGSKFSASSIWNEFGTYGSKFSNYSAFYQYATNPPLIIDGDGNIIGRLTVNKFAVNPVSPNDLALILKNLGV